ncbi:MAG: lytic transglycosylase domain-containing protein [Candidatus Adiutrix sp.]|jgi:soluble lytic murein transglycosylase-like protein|nr:lytic transglycosylase domain-containing protein [Candidatus Adiutrix sp.]
MVQELAVWLLCALAAFLPALYLAMLEHQRELEDFITLPHMTPEPPAVGLGLNAPEARLLTEDPLNEGLLSLNPEPAFLKELSDNTDPAPIFNAALARYEEMIENTARLHQVSPVLVKAVIQAESNFNPNAVSQNGAVGLMQLMPNTARSMGITDLTDPQDNITAGVKYLRQLLTQFNDDERLAIAAYNCGPEVMKRFGGQLPPFKETRAFVDKVMLYYNFHLEG